MYNVSELTELSDFTVSVISVGLTKRTSFKLVGQLRSRAYSGG